MKENLNAMVAVKTSNGMSKRINLSNVIMQGTVWGGLMCTSSMDKLGKFAYNNPIIPPLWMVDDVLTVSNVNKTVELNTLVNTFIEHKELKQSDKKFVRIHV